MKITNKAGLPEAIVKAVTNDPYTSGGADYSVTTLLKPPRAVRLEKDNADRIENDASDRIWALLGQLMHGVLERSATEGEIEKRHTVKVGNVSVSGAVDVFHEGIIYDYKLITAHKVAKGVSKEYESQLNLYAALIRRGGREVKALKLVCILRDWNVLEASRNDNYPRQAACVLEVPLWHPNAAETFLETKVRQHETAKISLPECTPEERWARPDKFAVMLPGRKSAVKLFDTREMAEQLAASLGKGAYAELRPGDNVRCRSYCAAAPFCEQAQKLGIYK